MPYTRAFLLYCAVMVPTVLVASIFFFMLVERPCMNPRWPRDLRNRIRSWRGGQSNPEPAGAVGLDVPLPSGSHRE